MKFSSFFRRIFVFIFSAAAVVAIAMISPVAREKIFSIFLPRSAASFLPTEAFFAAEVSDSAHGENYFSRFFGEEFSFLENAGAKNLAFAATKNGEEIELSLAGKVFDWEKLEEKYREIETVFEKKFHRKIFLTRKKNFFVAGTNLISIEKKGGLSDSKNWRKLIRKNPKAEFRAGVWPQKFDPNWPIQNFQIAATPVEKNNFQLDGNLNFTPGFAAESFPVPAGEISFAQFFAPENLTFFTAGFDWRNVWQNCENLIQHGNPDWFDFLQNQKKYFFAATGFDFESDIAPLFAGQTSIGIGKNFDGQIVFDAKNEIARAGKIFQKVENLLEMLIAFSPSLSKKITIEHEKDFPEFSGDFPAPFGAHEISFGIEPEKNLGFFSTSKKWREKITQISPNFLPLEFSNAQNVFAFFGENFREDFPLKSVILKSESADKNSLKFSGTVVLK